MATKKPKLETNLFVMTGQEDGFDPYGWNGLPEFNDNTNEAPFMLSISIKDDKTLHEFADLIGQSNLKNDTKRFTKSIWYPELIVGERGSNINYAWMEEDEIVFPEKHV